MARKHKKQIIPAVDRIRVVDRPLQFSFKHLDFENEKFHPNNCCANYFRRLFEVMRKYQTWTVGQFGEQNNLDHRHLINFNETTEPQGFKNIPGLDPDQFGAQDGWEFALVPDIPWNVFRAHGVILEDTFYIIWLDEFHRLYPINQAPAPVDE